MRRHVKKRKGESMREWHIRRSFKFIDKLYVGNLTTDTRMCRAHMIMRVCEQPSFDTTHIHFTVIFARSIFEFDI